MSETDLVQSALISITTKSKMRKLFIYLAKFNPKDPSTYEGLQIAKMSFRDLLTHFKIDQSSSFDYFGYESFFNGEVRFHDIKALFSGPYNMILQCKDGSIDYYGYDYSSNETIFIDETFRKELLRR